jgi:hypothetical protein
MPSASRASISKLARLAVLCLLGLAFLKVPLAAIHDSRDFAIIYLSALSWRQGIDPYKTEPFHDSWAAAGGAADNLPDWPSIYPICTFPLVVPLTLLNWANAKLLWMLINSLAFIALILLLLSSFNYNLNNWRSIILFGVLLFYFPAQFAIAMGQPIILALLFGVLSLRAAASTRWLTSGILLALSLSLKLNLGVIFLGYVIIYRKWPIIGRCLVAMALITAVGALRLGWDNFSWVFSWFQSLQLGTVEWATAQPEWHYPNSIFLINLHYPLYKIIVNKSIVSSIALAFGFIGLVILLKARKFNKTRFGQLTMITAVAAIVLVSSYHRLADATALIFLIILISLMIKTTYNKYSIILTLLILPIYLPGSKHLLELTKNGTIPHTIAMSWFWSTIVLPYQVYCLLGIAIVMLFLVVVNKERFTLNI